MARPLKNHLFFFASSLNTTSSKFLKSRQPRFNYSHLPLKVIQTDEHLSNVCLNAETKSCRVTALFLSRLGRAGKGGTWPRSRGPRPAPAACATPPASSPPRHRLAVFLQVRCRTLVPGLPILATKSLTDSLALPYIGIVVVNTQLEFMIWVIFTPVDEIISIIQSDPSLLGYGRFSPMSNIRNFSLCRKILQLCQYVQYFTQVEEIILKIQSDPSPLGYGIFFKNGLADF